MLDEAPAKEAQILCSAAYPIDFHYDGAMVRSAVYFGLIGSDFRITPFHYGRKSQSLTSVALHFQRKSRDGEEALHMLNVTVPLIPQNSGNYSIFSVDGPDVKTTVQIAASSDYENFLSESHYLPPYLFVLVED